MDSDKDWAIASELAAVLNLSRGRISQLVREGVLTPRRRHGKTQFYIPDAVRAYEAAIAPRSDTMLRRAELAQILAGPGADPDRVVAATIAEDCDEDDELLTMPGPLLPHGVSTVISAALTSAFWDEVITTDPNSDDPAGTAEAELAEVVATPVGQRVVERVLRAARLLAWMGLSTGLTYDDEPDLLQFLSDEAAPVLRHPSAALLRELCRADGIDPGRPLAEQVDAIPHWSQREAIA